jgi:hypothetical protein
MTTAFDAPRPSADGFTDDGAGGGGMGLRIDPVAVAWEMVAFVGDDRMSENVVVGP